MCTLQNFQTIRLILQVFLKVFLKNETFNEDPSKINSTNGIIKLFYIHGNNIIQKKKKKKIIKLIVKTLKVIFCFLRSSLSWLFHQPQKTRLILTYDKLHLASKYLIQPLLLLNIFE